jgi:hypothetical protein
MKKISFILGGLILMSIALTSCKKDYTCECTDPTDGTKYETKYTNTTKKVADDACNLLEITGDACELK